MGARTSDRARTHTWKRITYARNKIFAFVVIVLDKNVTNKRRVRTCEILTRYYEIAEKIYEDGLLR